MHLTLINERCEEILRYAKFTLQHGLKIVKSPMHVSVFSDADGLVTLMIGALVSTRDFAVYLGKDFGVLVCSQAAHSYD